MTEDIVKFDATKLAEQVQARVRGAITDLIPEDAWQQMIQREIKLWIEGAPSVGIEGYKGYRHGIEPGIRAVVRQELENKLRANVTETLKSNEWAGGWVGGRQQIGEEVKKLIVENAPQLLNAMLGSAIQQMVNSMTHGIQLR